MLAKTWAAVAWNATLMATQLGFVGCVSDVAPREARKVGEKAAARKTRTMEDEFISASGTDVTDAFRLYLRPNAVERVLNRPRR